MEKNVEDGCSEIAVLKSIYGSDLVVRECTSDRDPRLSVEIKVQPIQVDYCSTASIRVKFLLSDNYPSQPPQILLLQPRGIDDINLNALNAKLKEYLNNNPGVEVLYDLIQLTQTFIENVQTAPSALCPICLGNFSSKQPSLCTSCEHFVHTHCFSSYIRYSKAEIQKQLNEWPEDMKYKVDQVLRCPVCRLELSEKDLLIELTEGDYEEEDDQDFKFDWDNWKHMRDELLIIYERQLRKGGIIDLEEEKNRNLVTEDTFVTVSKEDKPETGSGSCSQKEEADGTSSENRSGRKFHRFHRGDDEKWRQNYGRGYNTNRGSYPQNFRRNTGRRGIRNNDSFFSKKYYQRSDNPNVDAERCSGDSSSVSKSNYNKMQRNYS